MAPECAAFMKEVALLLADKIKDDYAADANISVHGAWFDPRREWRDAGLAALAKNNKVAPRALKSGPRYIDPWLNARAAH